MMKTLLAATAIAALSAFAVPATSHADGIEPPTNVKAWFHSLTTVVVESVYPSGVRQCSMTLLNDASMFGITTTGPALTIWLHDEAVPHLVPDTMRLQFDTREPWSVAAVPDIAATNMIDSRLDDADSTRFIDEVVGSQVLHVEIAATTYTFSLEDASAAAPALAACERALSTPPVKT